MAIMTSRAEALPVAPVPEQGGVTFVRLNVVDQVRRASAHCTVGMVDQPLARLAPPLAGITSRITGRASGVVATVALALGRDLASAGDAVRDDLTAGAEASRAGHPILAFRARSLSR